MDLVEPAICGQSRWWDRAAENFLKLQERFLVATLREQGYAKVQARFQQVRFEPNKFGKLCQCLRMFPFTPQAKPQPYSRFRKARGQMNGLCIMRLGLGGLPESCEAQSEIDVRSGLRGRNGAGGFGGDWFVPLGIAPSRWKATA